MLKSTIKRIIGQENITRAKQTLKFVKDARYLRSHKRIICEDTNILYQKFSQKEKHVFFGYYDIQQLDRDEKYMLVHIVPRGADATSEKAELGFYDLNNGQYTSFSNTAAWCWQQGARLRWHPYMKNVVIYNDVENEQYVAKEYDLENGTLLNTYCTALYDIDSQMKYGLSLNFSRLQRLRPGYGYSILTDTTESVAAPNNDGIFYVDLKANTKTVLITLSDLAADVSDPAADQHYINHISIAPDGSKFMFFHIWTLKGDTHWRTRLCVYDFSDQKVSVLEDKDRVSHYDWRGNDELLVTCWGADKKQYYCIYNVKKNTKTVIQNQNLCHDGHPTFIGTGNTFISDTYPLHHDMQTLFEYNIETDNYRPLLSVYSDARLFEEKRCDLHPRLSNSEKVITIDTTCENGLKQVLLIKNWREVKNA